MEESRLIWADVETTGLDSQRDYLLEVAFLVTDADLNPLDEGYQTVIRPGSMRAALTRLEESPIVHGMHQASGLLSELEQGTSSLLAGANAVDYLRKHSPGRDRLPLAGSSVGFDRGFIQARLPGVATWFHYRSVDVSTIKELVRRWYPPEILGGAPEKKLAHRAMPDLHESIDELRYYRETVFRR